MRVCGHSGAGLPVARKHLRSCITDIKRGFFCQGRKTVWTLRRPGLSIMVTVYCRAVSLSQCFIQPFCFFLIYYGQTDIQQNTYFCDDVILLNGTDMTHLSIPDKLKVSTCEAKHFFLYWSNADNKPVYFNCLSTNI